MASGIQWDAARVLLCGFLTSAKSAARNEIHPRLLEKNDVANLGSYSFSLDLHFALTSY